MQRKSVSTLFRFVRIRLRSPRPDEFLAASSLARSAVPSLQVLRSPHSLIPHWVSWAEQLPCPGYTRAAAVAALVGFTWISDQINRFAITRVGLKLYAGLRSACIEKYAHGDVPAHRNPDTWSCFPGL
jgi:hypothetical protein